MALDASIYNNLGRGVKSVQEYDAEAQANQANKLAMMMKQAQYDEYGRKLADDNALRAVVGGFGADDNANVQSLFKAGRLPEAQAYQKSILDNAQTKAKTSKEVVDTDAKKLESSIKAHDFHTQLLGSLTDPAQVPEWVQRGVQSGVFPPEAAPGIMQRFQAAMQQPGGFEQWKAAGLQGGQSATEQLKQQQALLIANNQNATSRANNADTNATHIKTTGMSNAVTMRGQNMTDARTKESTAATMTKPFEVTGADGTPQLVQMGRDGKLQPVPGFGPKAGSAKPLTEAQGKDLGYGSRMREADKIIGELTGKYSPAGVNAKIAAEGIPGIGGIAGPLANSMLSDSSQKAEQAQRDFANAVLRRESGAAISPSEFENARKQYFPQPGDGAAVLAQKASNRKLAMEGVMAAVPPGSRASLGPQGGLPAADAIAAELKRRGL